MALVARETDAVSTGHLCTPITALDTPSQSTVYVESLLWARKDDPTNSHTIGDDIICTPHVATVGAGSSSVYVDNKQAARVNDACDSDKITGSAATVYAG